MNQWLVDCGPLGQLAALAKPEWAWPGGTLHVVREVQQEALASGSTLNPALLGYEADGQPWVHVHDIPIPSEAADMLIKHLRPRSAAASKNIGEDASIALGATTLSSAVFVTADKTAAFVALAELGRARVASPYDLWEALRDDGLIPNGAFEGLCERTARQLAGVLPGPPWRHCRK